MINPFSDLGKETQNPFLDTRIRIWISPKKRNLNVLLVLLCVIEPLKLYCFVVFLYSSQEEQPSDVSARVPSRQYVCSVVDGLQVDSR